MGLVYSSQDARKIDRLYRKQGKLEAKLVGPYCARPKSMHRRTFARISKKLDTVLGKQNRLFAQSARKFLDRHGWPSHDAMSVLHHGKGLSEFGTARTYSAKRVSSSSS